MDDFVQNGFLLSRQSQDQQGGICVTLWIKTKQGPVKLTLDNELAVFFVTNDQVELALKILRQHHITLKKVTQLPLKTFAQQAVTGFYFAYLKDYYGARERLKQQQIKCFEDDFRPDDRYLMERFITAGIDFMGQEISVHACSNEQGPGYRHFNQVRCKPNTCDVSLSMLSLDIECAMSGDLYSIAAYSDSCRQVFMIGNDPDHCGSGVDKSTAAPDKLDIIWLDNEQILLEQFIVWLQQQDPDIIIGWNVINFDMQLLQKRCDLHGIAFVIGRDGKAPYWRKNKNSEQQYIEIAGRVVLDGIDLLKTATYSFPSFSLDNVANSLLGIGKKINDVDDRMAEITDMFDHNKTALAAYNLEDCRLVWLIFEKTSLLDFARLRAQLTGLAIDRIGGSVAAFTNLYLPKLHRSGYVAPNMGDGDSDLISPGGYVMDSIPGLYKNVLVLDFKSLYPSIIRTFKIDPMGLIEGLNAPANSIPGFDGAYFSRDKHFLPQIIESLWSERDKAKRDKNAALSQAIKIIMNSFYGVLGSSGCRFYDPRLSGSITKRSHAILKTSQQWIEQQGYLVIYGDTDSIFVHLGDNKSAKQCQTVGVELQQMINARWQQKLAQDHQVVSQLEIEFETHFSQFLMPRVRGLALAKGQNNLGTKKRYAGLIQTGNEKKLIFKGMETVRSDWTELSKIFQQTLYAKVFNKQPVSEYIKDIVARTYRGEFDHQLIYRKRLRRKLALYVKNVPPHVKAARLADQKNKQLGKPLKYQGKGWIEYLITLDGAQVKEYLTSPLDYDFYVDRQLKAVADDILPFIGTSFSEITDAQLTLFS